jgi:hypothetical protein
MCRLKLTMDGQVAVLAVAERGSFEAASKVSAVEHRLDMAVECICCNRISP